MAITALHSAATGMQALSSEIDVIANNLANAETQGFKSQRVNFEDLFYETMKSPGSQDAAGNISPGGIFVGLGTRISNTQLDMTEGNLQTTNQPLDVAIYGNGFFRVKVLDGIGDGTAYTRNGSFFINSQNQLVLGMGNGYTLVPPVTVPTGTTNIQITPDGVISGQPQGSTTSSQIAQLQIYQFVNPQGMKLMGGSLYQQTDSSGQPIQSKPGDQGAGELQQGTVEQSNVDPVNELVSLIQVQRAFELNSQSIQTADQTLQTVTNLRKG